MDLRTYLKNIRHVQLLTNTLLSEKQRSLLSFQKLKVLDSGSTSDSDDRFYEPSVTLKNADAWLHKKEKHTEITNRMIKGYA